MHRLLQREQLKTLLPRNNYFNLIASSYLNTFNTMPMTSHPSNNAQRMRQRLALEAARIMAEEGVNDYHLAKRKAAVRLGAAGSRNSPRNLPRNDEIQQALEEYLRLFKANSQPATLKKLRQTAAQMMRLLQQFNPRLVGSVLSGTASAHSNINLHIFAATPKDVILFLIHQRIPYECAEKQLTLMDGSQASYPAYHFTAQDVLIEVIVFDVDDIRQAPRSPTDGHSMKRASLAAVENLLSDAS